MHLFSKITTTSILIITYLLYHCNTFLQFIVFIFVKFSAVYTIEKSTQKQ